MEYGGKKEKRERDGRLETGSASEQILHVRCRSVKWNAKIKWNMGGAHARDVSLLSGAWLTLLSGAKKL